MAVIIPFKSGHSTDELEVLGDIQQAMVSLWVLHGVLSVILMAELVLKLGSREK